MMIREFFNFMEVTMKELVCSHCGEKIEDVMFTLEGVPGAHFCCTSCALNFEENEEV